MFPQASHIISTTSSIIAVRSVGKLNLQSHMHSIFKGKASLCRLH